MAEKIRNNDNKSKKSPQERHEMKIKNKKHKTTYIHLSYAMPTTTKKQKKKNMRVQNSIYETTSRNINPKARLIF